MIDGEKIVIGGKEYIFPDLTLGAMQKIQPLMGASPESLSALKTSFCLGLKRNYPDMTEEFLDDNATIEDIAVMDDIMARQNT